ncbi:hypothetical protein PVK06_036973 [Gossypium arboreum]|uniref:Uncharacterized protein n=1 Tax=Gossypium arboreum TaxID=29729 RepID=A0ABR0NKY9_GOSAR|nr:hypothetical protein PVK06_036973 [Gossypium arboreum]
MVCDYWLQNLIVDEKSPPKRLCRRRGVDGSNDNVLHNANVVHPPNEGNEEAQAKVNQVLPRERTWLTPYQYYSKPGDIYSHALEQAYSHRRRHPLAPTFSFEVVPTAGVSTLAPRHESKHRLAWSRIDMVSTMYVPEAKLDSLLLAPLHHLHSVDEQHLHYTKRKTGNKTGTYLEPPTPLLLHRLLGGDFSSTMRFYNQSSQTVAEGSTITPVQRVPNSIFREVRFLYGKCCKPSTSGDSDSVGPPYTTTAPGVSALAYDHFNFETTSQEMIIFVFPEDLSQHIVSSKKAQVKWYWKLLQAWKEVKPPPKTPKEVARLIVETLSRHQKADVEPLQLRVNISRENIKREENQVPNREQNRNVIPCTYKDFKQLFS